MSLALAIVLAVCAFGAGGAIGALALRQPSREPGPTGIGRRLSHERGRAEGAGRGQPQRRILLPFAGTSISRRSLEAAVRLARAEGATIMPTFLARVPRHLPLDAPLPIQCERAMPLLEAIEQRVSAQGVSVDARVSRGRTYRDSLRHLLDSERVDRIIVSTTTDERTGLNKEDLQWLLQKVPAEVLILRAGFEDEGTVTAEAVEGHF